MIVLDRLLDLVVKLVSVKGVAFTLATIFRFRGELDTNWWAVFTLMLIGWRAFEKVFVQRKL